MKNVLFSCLLMSSLASCASTNAMKSPAAGEAAGDSKADLDRWNALAQPSDKHHILNKMAGVFKVHNEFWSYPGSKPGAPPAEATATSENKMIFGGRFLLQNYQGPPVATGYFGYNNPTQTYQYVWLDELITGITTMEGVPDASGTSITFTSDSFEPVSGQKMKVRVVLHVESDQKHTFAMYETGQDGKESQSMEMVYTREPRP